MVLTPGVDKMSSTFGASGNENTGFRFVNSVINVSADSMVLARRALKRATKPEGWKISDNKKPSGLGWALCTNKKLGVSFGL